MSSEFTFERVGPASFQTFSSGLKHRVLSNSAKVSLTARWQSQSTQISSHWTKSIRLQTGWNCNEPNLGNVVAAQLLRNRVRTNFFSDSWFLGRRSVLMKEHYFAYTNVGRFFFHLVSELPKNAEQYVSFMWQIWKWLIQMIAKRQLRPLCGRQNVRGIELLLILTGVQRGAAV